MTSTRCIYSFATSECLSHGDLVITADLWSSYLSGWTTVVAKRYNHKFLAERVYNDLTDLVYLLYKLEVTPLGGRHEDGTKGVGHFLFSMMLQEAAGNFTRTANESAWADENPRP